jgi:hypothetical protein
MKARDCKTYWAAFFFVNLAAFGLSELEVV